LSIVAGLCIESSVPAVHAIFKATNAVNAFSFGVSFIYFKSAGVPVHSKNWQFSPTVAAGPTAGTTPFWKF